MVEKLRISRVRSWLQSPWASLFLLALLSLDVSQVVDHSTLCQTILSPFGKRSTPQVDGGDVYIVRADDGSLRLIDPNTDSFDEISNAMDRRPLDIVSFSFTGWGEHDRGLWAATERHASSGLMMNTFSDSGETHFTPEEVLRARSLAGQWLLARKIPEEETDRLVASGNYAKNTPIRSGSLHNTMSATIAAMFFYSLRWILRVPAYLATSRHTRRLRQARCPHCGYSIAGLRDDQCPECGKSWNRTAEDPPWPDEDAQRRED